MELVCLVTCDLLGGLSALQLLVGYDCVDVHESTTVIWYLCCCFEMCVMQAALVNPLALPVYPPPQPPPLLTYLPSSPGPLPPMNPHMTLPHLPTTYEIPSAFPHLLSPL